ncbi:hypothetical protein TSAR_012858 [Trichomalopsis sarcophagae]|uniref:Uncharacterized protein n=1 Tax=Trichomalopsis sarcophagae TaxID=543379 RepID=A0A232FD82_9HYME|nr:hypothetical protein TSAR_012858 [Trichomalopsis sarcophagae]
MPYFYTIKSIALKIAGIRRHGLADTGAAPRAHGEEPAAGLLEPNTDVPLSPPPVAASAAVAAQDDVAEIDAPPRRADQERRRDQSSNLEHGEKSQLILATSVQEIIKRKARRGEFLFLLLLEWILESSDRHSHTFSLLNPTPIRSLSEVRRMHRSAEDSVQLMSSE